MTQSEPGRQLASVLGPIDADMEFLTERLGVLQEKTKEGTPIEPKDQQAIQHQVDEIGPRLEKIESLKEAWGDFARELERVKNALENVKREFEAAPRAARDNDQALLMDRRAFESLQEACRAVLQEIRLLLVPLRFNEQVLSHRRVGAVIDFLHDYEDELSKETGKDLRTEVLKRLKQDKDLLGWVDVQAGVIYRTSTSAKRKLLSGLLVLGPPVVGLVGFVVAALLVDSLGWSWKAAALNYIICFGGYLTHVVKKMAGSAGRDPLLDDFAVLLDIKALQFASLGLSLWIVYALMGPLGIFKDMSVNMAATAFAAGFGVDSLAEPALKQFDRRISSKIATVQQTLIV